MLAIKTKKSKKSKHNDLKRLKMVGWGGEPDHSQLQYNTLQTPSFTQPPMQHQFTQPPMQRQFTQPPMQRHDSQMPAAPPPSNAAQPPGMFSSLKGKITDMGSMAKSPMFMVATATVLLICGVYYANSKTGFLTAKPVPQEQAQVPQEPVVTEEDRQKWAAEQIALEKVKMRDAADNLREKLGQIHASIQKNMAEAKNNETNYKQLFSGNESSDGHDESLSSMEQESNLNTAFMLKEDLEKKKAGMVNLGRELGEHQKFLINEINQVKAQLAGLNDEWLARFPEEDPLFMESASAPTIPNSHPQQMSREQRAAMEEHQRIRNQERMMPDAVIDGTGRESIP